MQNFFYSGVPHLGRSKLKDMGMHSWAWNPAKSDLTKKRIFVFLLLLSQKYTFSLSRLLSHDVKVNNVANKTKPVTADASMVIRLKTQSLSTQITLRMVTQRSLVDASHHEWQNQASKSRHDCRNCCVSVDIVMLSSSASSNLSLTFSRWRVGLHRIKFDEIGFHSTQFLSTEWSLVSQQLLRRSRF